MRQFKGYYKTKLYRSWQNMKRRCNNPDKLHKKYYFGIRVCDEWNNSSSNFIKWALENGYKEGYTLERKDNLKGYCPENCCWIPKCDQNKNKRNNHLVEIDGVIKPISIWCLENNIKWTTFYARFKRGVRGKDLLKEVQNHSTLAL